MPDLDLNLPAKGRRRRDEGSGGNACKTLQRKKARGHSGFHGDVQGALRVMTQHVLLVVSCRRWCQGDESTR